MQLTIGSPKGEQSLIEPKSESSETLTQATERFYSDIEDIDKVAHTLKLSDVNQADYDAVFYPGGHSPLWDLANDELPIHLIEDFYNHQKPIIFVCHAPAALIKVNGENGEPLIQGKEVTTFSDTEDEAVGLTKIVPFLLEDELQKLDIKYSKGINWRSFVKKDGLLIIRQNSASSSKVAKLLLSTILV